jgi:simple sugar transport system permease protein
MAGLNEVFGYKFRYIDGMLTSTRYAWTGLMSALIAGLNPIGMFIVSIFLAGLQIGGQAVQRTVGIPLEMATIIQCCMTLFVSVKIGLNFKTQKQAKEPEKEVTK